MLKTKNIFDHVAPFLKRANSSVSNCSLREGFIDLIKSSFKLFFFLVYSRALVSTFQLN